VTIAAWIVSGLLALAYLFAGIMKTFAPGETLKKQMAYTEDYTRGQVRAIGIVEVAGAVGLILPHATGILPWLSVVAAFAFVLLQVFAIRVHVRRKETIVPGIVLGILALAAGVLLILAGV
jgi:uncharacterized membrane protein